MKNGGKVKCLLNKSVHTLGFTFQRFSRVEPRGRAREWAPLGVHPLSWLLSNNRLEKVPFVSVPHTSSNRLLLSNQDKGYTPSVAHSLPLPLGPALLNLSSDLGHKCLYAMLFCISIIPNKSSSERLGHISSCPLPIYMHCLKFPHDYIAYVRISDIYQWVITF